MKKFLILLSATLLFLNIFNISAQSYSSGSTDNLQLGWNYTYRPADELQDIPEDTLYTHIDIDKMVLFLKSTYTGYSSIGLLNNRKFDWNLDISYEGLTIIKYGLYDGQTLIFKKEIRGVVGKSADVVIITKTDTDRIWNWLNSDIPTHSVRFIIPLLVGTDLDFTVPAYKQ